jgi:hypothetical protein
VDTERIMKQGLLMDKERERDAVEIKIDRCVKDLVYYSYAFPTEGVTSIDADAVLQAAKELKTLHDQWKDLTKKIKDLRERCDRG